ncbi:MAG: hypothetical protein ACYTF1_17160 [Planctomycetota bacterium]|jgi:hypothetical protein
MRKEAILFAAAVMAAVPGISLGLEAALSVFDHHTGSDVSNFNPAVDSSITFDVLITTWITYIDAIQYSISADKNDSGAGSGDNDWKFDPNTPWINGSVFAEDDYIQIIGTDAGKGKTMAELNYDPDMGPEFYFMFFGYISPPLTGALLATYVLEPVNVTVGDVYVLWLVEIRGICLATALWNHMLVTALHGMKVAA